MIDIDSFIISQKLKWVKLYLNNHNSLWCSIMENLIKIDNLKLMLRCNFSMRNRLTNSSFYLEILSILSTLHNLDTSKKLDNLFNQFIFYNKLVEIDGKTCYDSEFFIAGLWKISDLFNDKGEVITFDTWVARGVSKHKYMKWRGIINKVKSCINSRDEVNFDSHSCIYLESGDTIDLENSVSNHVYRCLVKLKFVIPTGLQKYCILFENLSDCEIEIMYVLARLMCKDIDVQIMQFKILHRYIPTNDLLFKMDKVDTNKCPYCNMYPEAILHLFYECATVKTFWLNVQDHINFYLQSNICLLCKDIIIGFNITECNNANIKLVNKVILYGKLFIWNSRGKLISLNISNFKEWLQKRKVFAFEIDEFIDCF